MIAHLKGREKALEAFGWTGRSRPSGSRFVCLHSGVFTRDQVDDWFLDPRARPGAPVHPAT